MTVLCLNAYVLLTKKIVVITGGHHGIGKTTKEAFEAEGAIVEVIDIAPGDHYV